MFPKGDRLILAALFLASSSAYSLDFPQQVREISYASSIDGTEQPALFYSPKTDSKKPLLVGLHTWSGDYHQDVGVPYARWCIRKDWVFIYPNFRGPNKRPKATGSEASVQDIVDAVEYARENANVDVSRIYAIGVSGGGAATLLVAGRHPEIWAGVSSWVPVTDLKEWYLHCKAVGLKYAKDIVASVGGIPTQDPKADAECKLRSVLTYLSGARNVPIDLNAGIHDGHPGTGSIPIDHSLRAFNLLANPEDRFSQNEIAFMVENATLPTTLRRNPAVVDPLYGEKKVLLRRESNNIRLTLFEGRHEIIYDAALNWLEKQRKP